MTLLYCTRLLLTRHEGRRQLAEAMRARTIPLLPRDFDSRQLDDSVYFEPRLFAWHFGSGNPEVELLQLLTRAPRCLPESQRIELVQCADPVLRSFIGTHVVGGRDIEFVEGPDVFAPLLMRALKLIDAVAPAFHRALLESVRAIVLFRHRSLNSFAALGLHGMIFLNVSRPATLSLFMDGLVHQGGHVLFSEATLDRPSLFIASPDENIGAITDRRDSRSLYEVLHGVFTELALVEILSGVRGRVVDACDIVELSGRMALALERLESDVALLTGCLAGVFNERGREMVGGIREGLEAHRKRGPLDHVFDLGGQPDDFDLDTFLARNPAYRRPFTPFMESAN